MKIISSRYPASQAGFSLVELMISSVLIVLSAVGSAGLFMLSNRQSQGSRIAQESQAAINSDMAAVLSANDRFSCASSSGASATCEIKGFLPNQNQYFPFPCSNAEDCDFWSLCVSTGDPRLASEVAAAINALPGSADFARLALTRNAVPEPISNSEPNFRYTVTWSDANGVQLRQLTLVPTAAAWCPGPEERQL